MSERIGTAVLELTTEVGNVKTVLTDLQKQLGGLRQKFDEADRQANSFGTRVKGVVGRVGELAAGFITAQAVMRGVGAVFDFAKGAAIDMNASLEKSTLQFTTLMGDSQRAEKHVRDLFQFAKTTPFETGPIIEASRRMQTFGGDALNTLGNLTLLGDAAAATGAPIEDLGFWVGRMFAALQGGQPIGEATMRLMELGVLTPEVRVQMESLAETAGGGEKAFKLFQDSIGKFNGAMVAQASTWDGLMSSISDAINITLADALKPFFDTVKAGAQMMLQVLGSEGVQNVFEQASARIKAAFGGESQNLVRDIADKLLMFASVSVTAADVLYRLGNGMKTFWAAIGGGVTMAVGAVLRGLEVMTSAAAKIPGTGQAYDDAAAAITRMRESVEGLNRRFSDAMTSSFDAARGNTVFSETMAASKDVIAKLREELQRATIATTEGAVSQTRAGAAISETTALTEEQKKALAEKAKEWKKLQTAIADFGRETTPFYEALQKGWFGKIETELKDTTSLVSHSLPEWAEMRKRAEEWAFANGAVLAPSIKAVGSALEETSEKTSVFGGILGNLGDTILQAFQGGGDVLKSIGGSIGKKLGENVVGRFGESITGLFGKTLGGVINQIIPGVGALLGPLMSKIGGFFKGLFGGVSPEVKAARDEVTKFQQQLEATLTVTQRQEAGNERWKMTVIAVRDAYLATGRTAAEAEAIVRQLWDTDHPERAKAAMEQINAVLAEQKEKYAELASLQEQLAGLQKDATITIEDQKRAADELGISYEALGPSFDRAQLTESITRAWDAFRTLQLAGVDTGTILSQSKDKFIQLGQEAQRFGVRLPENFRPVFEELDRAGLLTDEFGNKLVDVSDLEFGDPIVSKLDEVRATMQIVADKIEALTNQLALNLPRAADTAARGVQDAFRDMRVDIPVHFSVSDFDLPAIPMARGGVGVTTRPTLFLASEHGQREEFAFSGEGGTFRGGLGSADLSGVESRLDRLERALMTTIPTMVESAARHGALTAGRRR